MSPSVGCLALPAQSADGELDVIVLMLPCDYESISQFAREAIGIPVVHGIANSVIVIFYRLADDVPVVVVHLHDPVEVVAVVGVAVLRFGQVEGTGACGVNKALYWSCGR